MLKPAYQSISLRQDLLGLCRDAADSAGAADRFADMALQLAGEDAHMQPTQYLHRCFIEHRCEWFRILLSGSFAEGDRLLLSPHLFHSYCCDWLLSFLIYLLIAESAVLLPNPSFYC